MNLESLSAIIASRKAIDCLKGCPVALLPNDLDYLTPEERAKFHAAKLALPSQAELSNQAKARLATRKRGRKA